MLVIYTDMDLAHVCNKTTFCLTLEKALLSIGTHAREVPRGYTHPEHLQTFSALLSGYPLLQQECALPGNSLWETTD